MKVTAGGGSEFSAYSRLPEMFGNEPDDALHSMRLARGFGCGFGGLSRRLMEGLQFSDLCGLLASHGMPQIPVLLQTQPEVSGGPENAPESKRGVRCDPPITVRSSRLAASRCRTFAVVNGIGIPNIA